MTTATPARPDEHPDEHLDEPAAIDVATLFPADPDLMGSPEGDTKGLQELQEAARQRRADLHPQD
jgi:hypothetical protein